jgi:hypothetical protein
MEYAKKHGTKSGKVIGRPANSITLQTIWSAVYSAHGNYHEADRILIELTKKGIFDGLISLRLKRAEIAKNKIILEIKFGDYFEWPGSGD